jgi:iron-sulfur cluster assembly protein
LKKISIALDLLVSNLIFSDSIILNDNLYISDRDMIQIALSAAKEIDRLKASRQQPDSLLRLRIKSGGCSGLFYDLELESKSSAKIGSDLIYESNNVEIIVDSQSANWIDNLQLDYAEDLMGGGFRFKNPQAVGICGCGLSFSAIENQP